MIFPWVQLRSQALIRSRFAGLKLWGATSAASRRGLRGKGWPFFCFHKQHVQWDGGVYEGKLYNIVYPYIYILYMLGNVRMKTSVIIEISYNDGFLVDWMIIPIKHISVGEIYTSYSCWWINIDVWGHQGELLGWFSKSRQLFKFQSFKWSYVFFDARQVTMYILYKL